MSVKLKPTNLELFKVLCESPSLKLFSSSVCFWSVSIWEQFLLRVPLNVIQYSPKRRFAENNFCTPEVFGKLGILGVPFGKGQKKKGKDEVGLKIAPDIIRKTGFADILTSIGVDIIDYGNVQYQPECNISQNNMHNLDHFAPCAKAVSGSVTDILQQGRSCLVLGGDHSVAVGSIYAHMKVADPKKVALVYIDAHTDINTDKTSPSGNIHGMTVSLLAEELRDSWPQSGVAGLNWLSPCLSLKTIAYIGTRSVDFGEVKFLSGNKVVVFGIDDIEKYGIQKVLCKALAIIDPGSNKSIHVSFDIDALDYSEAPCTTVPVRGGLTLREGIKLAEMLNKTGRLSVVDLVEVNPAIGNEIQKQVTLDAAKHILLAMFGYCRRGNEKKKKQ